MNLMELCGNLESTLLQLEAARRGGLDLAAIDKRIEQWEEKRGDLLLACQCAGWLNVDLLQAGPYPAHFASTRLLAQEAVQRLEKRPDIQVLTEKDLWVRLLQTAHTASGDVWGMVKQAWGLKVEESRQLTSPYQLRITASPVPQNDVLLADYEVQYRTASRLAALETPKSASDPETFAQAIETCKVLAAQLRFDAPKDVEVFFLAINAGGASLALVTPTVLDWLADNDQLSRYTVRSGGR